MNKQTVAFVIGSLGSGGAERVVSTLANQLSFKYRIIIITFKNGEPFYPLSPEITLLHCVNSIEPSKNILQAIKSNYLLFRQISRFLADHQVKLAISFLTTANVLTVLGSFFNKVPVFISERNNPYEYSLPAYWQYLKKFCYPKAKLLIVQTAEIRKYFLASMPPKRVVILPNPISPDLTLARNSSQPRKKIVLNVGRNLPQKSQGLLIRAFSAIDSNGWELHIIGKGPDHAKLSELIRSLNVGHKIKLLPPTRQIHDHYNEASIFAFTSIFEGFPNALIEAMHFGLACVSTDCPTGPSELINNGENGFLIPMNDQLALQGRLQKLMNDETLRQDFGRKASESVRKFEIENIAAGWQELIDLELKSS